MPTTENVPRLPLYFKVIMNVKDRIVSGEWPLGLQIPGEIGLADELDVSVITIRQAMAHLVDQGYVRREQGKGTFVIWGGPLRQPVDLDVNAASLCAANAEPEFKLISIEKAPLSPQLMARLALKENEAISKIVRVRMLEKSPLAYICSYLPSQAAAALPRRQLARLSLANALEAFTPAKITAVRHSIGAALSNEEVSVRLGIPAGSPVLLIERDYLSKNKTIMVAIGHYRSDLFRYELTLPVSRKKKRYPWRHSAWVKGS